MCRAKRKFSRECQNRGDQGLLEVSTRNRWFHPALIKDETTSSKQPSYLMNMCRKETNDWKENEERDLCCENKEGNFIKMESGGQRGVEGAFMQYHSLSMTGRIVKVSRRKESLITGPQQENMYIASPTVLRRECTGHSKHPLPTTQEKTLHMDISRWSILRSD